MTREVWITGIGLTSSLGEGADVHVAAMQGTPPAPVLDRDFMPPFTVHPMVDLELEKQIPKRGDRRQMEPWQRLGTYTAGLALDDAGIKGDESILGRTHAVIAADGGERDVEVDSSILRDIATAEDDLTMLNQRLGDDLRPTLFLAQLPNLLAGNISIVHNVTGSSRTLMGEEIAGVSALEVASRRIAANQGDIFLVGGAGLGRRDDTILNLAYGGLLWEGEPLPVWQRADAGGGSILGSMGAFMVLEAREHAETRGRKPYAALGPVIADQTRRRPGDVAATFQRHFDTLAPDAGQAVTVYSGATGVRPATGEERDVLAGLRDQGRVDSIRGISSLLGSCISGMFPGSVALAALALSRGVGFAPLDGGGFEQPFDGSPERIAVTVAGHWRGEGTGLVTAVRDV